ncbi:MAG: hypothetical protein Q8P97_01985 [bacterium]|nr:hypothetical protein [bacterium]
MSIQEAQKEFEEQLAALEVVVDYLSQAYSLLRRSVEGKISLKGKDARLVGIVLTHYIVNNLAALFDNGSDVNSLTKITERFKKIFPDQFFSEYKAAVEKIRISCGADLERISKNRHLMTAHLGASQRERLGYGSQMAKNLDEIFGTQSHIAEKDSLQFISPYQLLDMIILIEIPKLRKILETLNSRVLLMNFELHNTT